jgi:hypothetical protein
MKNIVEYVIKDNTIRVTGKFMAETILNYLTCSELWITNEWNQSLDCPKWSYADSYSFMAVCPAELALLREGQKLLGFELVEV